MNKYIEEMIKQGIIVGGKIIEKNGFIIFKRLPFEELLKLNEQDLAYATQSMGRAIFTIDSNNKITNIKGVDSQLDNTELAPAQLVQAESVYISNPNKSYSESTYPINLVKLPGEQNNSLDIRFRGAAPLEDLEIEAEINKKMQYMGIKLPKIDFIKEFTKEFCESVGLPTKISGNYSELESDYAKQNDERKEFLKQEYGNQYQEEVIAGMRAETINEFFTRLGIYELPEFLEFAKKLNMTIEDFVKTVDSSYSLGQRYGQAQRLVESPFRISDLEYYVKTGNKNAINNITAFTEQSLNINDRFEIDYANQMGKNIAMLMNNGWVCENLVNRQDFTLAGEMCDDAYYDLKAHVMEINENTNFSTGKKKALKSDIMKDYFAQVFHISSTIKVLQDEMGLRNIDEQEINLVLETFVNSLTTNFDLNKISEILETDTEKLKEVFKVLLGKPSDYRSLLATKSRANGPEYDEPILLSHIDNNVFFNEVARKIAENMEIERSFVSESKSIYSPIESIERRKTLNEQNAYVTDQIQKYKKENSDLYKYIEDIVNKKAKEGIWDKGIDGESQDLTTMLLYEYASSLEKITDGNVSAKFVVDKLSREMGRFRFGDYKSKIDDVVTYDNISVTSDEYKKKCRIKTRFGAHAPTYLDGTEEKTGIVLFDDTQKFIDENGKVKNLSGIDLSNISDIRGTVFHEWTHCMEKILIQASKLSKQDIIFEKGNSKFINSMTSVDWKLEEYENYIDNVEDLISKNANIYFNGISTIEINRTKDNSKRIMHNQIDEGAVELICILIMEEIGDTVVDPSRYQNQLNLLREIFESRGIADSVTKFVTESNELVQELESHTLQNGSDLLHYMDDYVTLPARLEEKLEEQLKNNTTKTQEEIEIEINNVKGMIMDFWQNYSNPTEQELDVIVQEVENNLGLTLPNDINNLIRKTSKYPKITKDLNDEILQFYPKKDKTKNNNAPDFDDGNR